MAIGIMGMLAMLQIIAEMQQINIYMMTIMMVDLIEWKKLEQN